MDPKIILGVAIVIYAVAIWYVREKIPNLYSNDYFIAMASIVGVVLVYFIYQELIKKTGKCKRTATPGSCELDSDCNGPNGQCFKDKDGNCMCVCKPGYSGKNCEIKGIPYDSPHCMGPNSQWPPNKDKDGLCVCPAGNWADGTDPKYGYVQCLKCAGDWGPLAGKSPCASKWLVNNLVTPDCGASLMPPAAQCAPSEFGDILKYDGPNGEKPSTQWAQQCNGPNQQNSCRCSEASYRSICKVTGWMEPNQKNQTCDASTQERPCTSYRCR